MIASYEKGGSKICRKTGQFCVVFANFKKIVDRSKIGVLRQKKTKF